MVDWRKKWRALVQLPGIIRNVLRMVWETAGRCPACGCSDALVAVSSISLEAHEQQGDHPEHQEIHKVVHQVPVGPKVRAYRCKYCNHEVAYAASDDNDDNSDQ